MSTNHLPLNERLERGKVAEELILDQINALCPVTVNDITFTSFEAASEDEDMHGKIDAWGIAHTGAKHSVQIKNRESGIDLGLALIRPYAGDNWFCANYKAAEGSLNWDRDMVTKVDYYLIANEGQICLTESQTVRNGVNAILSNLYTSGGFRGGNTHTYSALDGLTLKLVKDIGAGYAAGQYKVICYVSLNSLMHRGAFLEAR